MPTLADVKKKLLEIVALAEGGASCTDWPQGLGGDLGHYCYGCTIGETATSALMDVEEIEIGGEGR